MRYIAVSLRFNPYRPCNEIAVAMLAELGFESFEEQEPILLAYIPENVFDTEKLEALAVELNKISTVSYTLQKIADRNWNAEWEKAYPVVTVDNKCIIRAPFHKQPATAFELDIVINPQMSFGTGHHDTTYLVLSLLLTMNLSNTSVLDMGSGTGVLAIAAAKMGAKNVVAIDNEDWAYRNTIENCALNNTEVNVEKGNQVPVNTDGFDLILANINKNILLDLMPAFAINLKKNGFLILSGFFTSDVDQVDLAATREGLKIKTEMTRNNWAVLKFEK